MVVLMANNAIVTFVRNASADTTSVTQTLPRYQHVRRRTPLTQPDASLNFETVLSSIADESVFSPLKPSTKPLSIHQPPFWLRKSALFIILALFTILLLSLLCVWRYAYINHGFSITLTANHLAWTYGPTAVVVLVVGVWRQVDSNIKSAQAWKVMKNGFAPAHETVLLDYTFPLQLQSFIKALRSRHFVVAESIGAFSLLKVVQFVSTGLLISLETSVPSPTSVFVDQIFNGTAFWLTQPPTNHLTAYPPYYLGSTGITFPNISRNSFYAYMAELQNDPLNFAGNTSLTAFPNISPPVVGNTNLTSITTALDVFVPKITCEIAEVRPLPPRSDFWGWSVNISSPTCPSFQNNENDPEAGTATGINFPYFSMGSSFNTTVTEPIYQQERINCSMAGSFDNYSELADFDRTGYFDYRFALFVVNVTTTEQVSSNSDSADVQVNNVIHNTAGVICKVDYYMSRASVTLNLQNQSYSMVMDNSETFSKQLDTLTASELLEILLSITTKGYNENVAANFNGNVMFPAIQNVLGSNSSTSDFFDSQKLQRASHTALSGISAQFMKESFIFPSSKTADGIGEWTQTRIQVSQVSLWMMVGGIALVSFLTLMLAVTSPKPVSLRSETIAGYATVLASSSSFNELLCSTQYMSQKTFETAFNSINFRLSNRSDNFEIEPSMKIPLDTSWKEETTTEDRKDFWRPYASQWLAIALILLLPLAAIAALEYMCQVSIHDRGVFMVSGNDSNMASAIRYTSTAIAFIIATLFNSLDFTVAIFAPFSAMSRRSTSAARSLLTNLLAPLPPVALYSALRQRHLGSALSSTASLIGSILSVVVSGLWVLQSSAQSHSVQASLSTVWNVTWHNSSQSDSGAAAAFNAIQHGSEKKAPNIWSDLVIPGIVSVGPAANDTFNLWNYARLESEANYTLTVPALRPKLNCTKMPPENVYATYIPPDARSPPAFMVSAWMDLPPQCVQWANSNYSYVNITTQLSTSNGKQYFGSLHDIHITSRIDDRDYINEVDGESEFNLLPDNPAGCPSLSVQFGYTEGQGYGSSPTIPQLTTLICYQQLEEVNATVNFIGNPSNMALDPLNPPQVDEANARLLTNGTADIDSFPYRVEPHIDRDFDEFNTPNGDAGSFPWGLDPFFKVMVGGPNNISLVALEDEQFLRNAVEKMYKAYMVNVINLNMKVPVTNSSATTDTLDTDETKVQGIMQVTIKRLSIDRTSKIILQGMLSIMTLFAALTYLLVDMRGVLPRNPCSIAGTMSLLAGSKICESDFLPAGAQTMNEKQLRKVFARREYSLGWWRDDNEAHLSTNDPTDMTSDNSHIREGGHRFGIDVGVPTDYVVKKR